MAPVRAERDAKAEVYTAWPFDAEAKRRRKETAEVLGVPVECEENLGNGVKMTFVLIPAGTFMMGSPNTEENRNDDETLHRVRISRPFYIGKYEVTQAQWKAVMGSNPSNFQGDQNPVEQVSWDDCQEFIKELNARLPSPLGRGVGGEGGPRQRFSLPTEAQWEYACRAGTDTPFHAGRTLSTKDENYYGNYPYGGGAKEEYRQKTIAVGSLAANAWGLYDMHGNVGEWCQDTYGDYGAGEAVDPEANAGARRVNRGGSWLIPAKFCRSAGRGWVVTGSHCLFLGCRLARRL
jgi:formylglycine-generating enzyme required for sulfatase activity